MNDTGTDTDATLLLGLEGLGVIKVEAAGEGLVVHVATVYEDARACPVSRMLTGTSAPT